MKIQLNRITAIRLLFFLYFLHFVMYYWGGEWTYANDKYLMMPIYTPVVNGLRFGYLFGFLALGIYEMVLNLRKLHLLDQILMLLFFLFTIFKIYDTSSLVDMQTLLFQSGTPIMYFMFLAFFIGMDDKIRDILQKMTKEYALIYLSLTLAYFVGFCLDIGYRLDVRFASSPILHSFNNGFFLLVYGLYQENTYSKNRIWKILFPLLVLDAIITTSRSWVIQSLLVIMMYFLLQGHGKRAIRNIFKTVGVIATIVVVIYTISPGQVNSLIARIGESTRSTQFEMFFREIKITDLIGGLGYNASYSFLHWSNYQFIDNQIIFNAFRYGAVIILTIVYFLIKPLFSSLSLPQEEKVRALGTIHFALSLIGLSIYCPLSIDVYCVASYALAGRLYVDIRAMKLGSYP